MCTEKFRAFTLIELLVVIAIIAILLSVIIPSMRKAKEQAKFTICKNGLHQYGLAGEMYLMDSDNTFANPYYWLYNYDYLDPAACAWHDQKNDFELNPENSGWMWPYIDSKKIHVCPKLREIAKPYGRYHRDHSPSISIKPQYGYVMNGYFGNGWYSEVPKKDGVKGPASCFFFAEESTWTLRDLSIWSLNNNHLIGRHEPYMPDDISGIFGTFHKVSNESIAAQVRAHIDGQIVDDKYMGVCNAVFLDGHLEVVSYKDTFRLGWPK